MKTPPSSSSSSSSSVVLEISEHDARHRPLGRENAATDREADQIGLGAETELAHQVRAVSFSRARADEEGGGDFGAGLPFGRELEHQSLAVGQGIVDIQFRL